MMIGQDMMITTSRIEIDKAIIYEMSDTMIIGEKMTNKMSIGGIVVTVTTVTIHPVKIEMIVALIEVINIMMIEGPTFKGEMKTIDPIIIDFRMIDGMITEDPRYPDNFSIIPKVEMSRNYRMFGNRIMRTTNPVSCQC